MNEVPSTKEFVEKYGLMAKKALGQNFLLDGNITDKIVRLSLEGQGLSCYEGQNVVEVGPGPGGLTQAVLRHQPAKMAAIEMDERCLAILEEIKQGYPQLEVVNGDALLFDWQKKAREEGNGGCSAVSTGKTIKRSSEICTVPQEVSRDLF